MTQPEPLPVPTPLDCPHCGKTSEVDARNASFQCPECGKAVAAFIDCARCRRRIPYPGDPKAMAACPACGADPLAPIPPGLRWKRSLVVLALLLGMAVTLGALANHLWMAWSFFHKPEHGPTND